MQTHSIYYGFSIFTLYFGCEKPNDAWICWFFASLCRLMRLSPAAIVRCQRGLEIQGADKPTFPPFIFVRRWALSCGWHSLLYSFISPLNRAFLAIAFSLFVPFPFMLFRLQHWKLEIYHKRIWFIELRLTRTITMCRWINPLHGTALRAFILFSDSQIWFMRAKSILSMTNRAGVVGRLHRFEANFSVWHLNSSKEFRGKSNLVSHD